MDNRQGHDHTTATGKDTNGAAHEIVKEFNKKYASAGYKAKLTEFPASADEQRAQFIQRQQAKSGDCDVFSSDVIWTAEFASQKWLYDLTPYIEQGKSTVHPGAARDRALRRQVLGRPGSDRRGVPLLPHRQGRRRADDVAGRSTQTPRSSGGIVYQGAPYEGLTCDFLELAFAAGGKVLYDDGKKSAIDSPENVKALQLMVDGIKDGAAPKAVTTYMEPETDQALDQTGKYSFMRNWTYAYAPRDRRAPQGQGQVRGRAAPELRGRRQGRHPRRPQQRDLASTRRTRARR